MFKRNLLKAFFVGGYISGVKLGIKLTIIKKFICWFRKIFIEVCFAFDSMREIENVK